MVDMVVHRHQLRPTLAKLCRLLTKAPPPETGTSLVPEPAHLPAPASA
jgi:acetyl-CoA carboxylase carboxyl transferase subunit beta